MKRERETKSKKPSNSIEAILPQASNNVKTRFYWVKWNMKGVSWTKWDERMTIESKNDENNSGNLYLKQKMVCILYTWHHFMPSMFDMQVNCPKSVLSCRKTIEENRVNRTNKNKKGTKHKRNRELFGRRQKKW